MSSIAEQEEEEEVSRARQGIWQCQGTGNGAGPVLCSDAGDRTWECVKTGEGSCEVYAMRVEL